VADSFLIRVLILVAGAPPFLISQDCTQQARTDLAPPFWSSIVTASSPGTYFDYQDGKETIFRGATFPAYSSFNFPASPNGSVSSATFPDEAPWAFNGGTADSLCPGLGETDCTGKQISRYAGSLVQSKRTDNTKGVQFIGSFVGGLTSAGAPSALVQVVFFHETPIYWGHSEYGFYYNAAIGKDAQGNAEPSRLVFYWSSNSNCGLTPFCRSKRDGGNLMYEDGSGQLGDIPPSDALIHGCTIPIPDASRKLVYEAWIFRDVDGVWKFRVEVRDADDLHEIVPGMTVLPNASAADAWFPIQSLTPDGGPGQGSGYITAGVVRDDPRSSMTYSTAPRMIIESLNVGRNPSAIPVPNTPHRPTP